MSKELFLFPLLLLSAACSETQEQGAAKDTAKTATSSASATVNVSTGEGGGTSVTATASSTDDDGEREVSVENDVYEFEYSYPSLAMRYDPLRVHLEAQLRKQQNELALAGAEDKADTEAAGEAYRKHRLKTEWETVADLPNWVSLSGETWTYSGGAHGNFGFDDILYDKRTHKVRQSIDLFQSSAALNTAISERFCAALDKERAKRRGVPVDKSDEVFGECPNLDDITVLLGSSNGKTFDRMTLRAAPYVAGPYAEGKYEVHLNVDAAVLKVVRPEYAEDFTIGR